MNAGIPIIAELSKVVGKSETEIKDMVSAGKIGFPEVQAVIKNMTSEGGLFFNLMAEQSKSLGGQISNLKDNFDQMLNEIGKASEGAVSGAISSVSFLVENYQTLGKIIAGLITTYGAYRAAIIVNITLTRSWAVAARADAIAKGIQTTATNIATTATKALNAAMKANPYVLVATALVGLVSYMVLFNKEVSIAEKAQKAFNEEQERQKNLLQEERNEIDKLIEVVKDENAAKGQRLNALNKLKDIYPDIFSKYKTEEELIRNISNALKELNNVQKEKDLQMDKAYIERLKVQRNGLEAKLKTAANPVDIANYKEQIQAVNIQIDKASKQHAWQSTLKRIDDIAELSADEQAKERKLMIEEYNRRHNAKLAKNQNLLKEGEKQDIRKTTLSPLATTGYENFSDADLGLIISKAKQLEEAEKERNKVIDTRNGLLAKQKELAEKISAIQSKGGQTQNDKDELSKLQKEKEDIDKKLKGEYNEQSKKAATKAKKETLPEFDTEKANRDHQRQIQDDLFRQEEARIKIMQDGTDKRLAIIQLEYDKQEEEIRRRSQDQLAAFIETKKAEAEAAGKWKKGQDFDTNTEAINAEKARLAENEKTLLASNAEYQRMQQEQVYRDLLEKYKTYEEEKNKIFEEFEKDRLELEKNNVNGQNDERIKELLKKKARKELEFKIKEGAIGDDIGVLFGDLSKKTSKQLDTMIGKAEEAFESFHKLFQGSNEPEILNLLKSIREGIENAKEKADEARPYFERLGKNFKKAFGKNREDGDGGEVQNYERQKAVSSIAKDIDNAREAMGVLTDMFKALGDAMDNKNLKEFAKTLNEISNIIDKTMKGAEVGGKIGKGAGAIIGAAIGLTTAIAQNVAAHEKKQREEINSLMLTKIEQQRTYNNLLFEQNLLLKKESSVFGEKEIAKAVNYMELYRQKTNEVQSKIKNGVLGNINIQSGYINHNYAQDTLKKISNGIASLWGGGSDEGTSRKVYSSIISQYKDLINEYGRLNLSRAESLLTSEFASEEQKRALQDLIDLEKQAQKAGEELDKYLESTFGQLGGDLMNDIVNSLKDGKDAFVEFGKSAGKVLEKLQKQMLFEVHFSERFKKFQEEIKNVYKKGGDSQSVAKEVNTLTSNFVQSMRSNVENATRDFKTFQDELQKNGLYSATSDRKSVEKGFARMSQDSADELNGQFRLQTQLSAEIKNATLQTANFIREMHQSMLTNAAQQLRHLAGIETNTYKLHKMETDLAGVKRGIDELTTKGIKMRT